MRRIGTVPPSPVDALLLEGNLWELVVSLASVEAVAVVVVADPLAGGTGLEGVGAGSSDLVGIISPSSSSSSLPNKDLNKPFSPGRLSSDCKDGRQIFKNWSQPQFIKIDLDKALMIKIKHSFQQTAKKKRGPAQT